MTVGELLQAIRDSGVEASTPVIIGREGKRPISERAADIGEAPLFGVRQTVGCTECIDGTAFAILYELPERKR